MLIFDRFLHAPGQRSHFLREQQLGFRIALTNATLD
jgi:hypothetical protein